MARQSSIGEWYCPACGGSGRGLGEYSDRWCQTCNGRGTVDWDPDKVKPPGENPLDLATDRRLWAVGFRNTGIAIALLAILAGLAAAVMITSTWLMAATPTLRSLAEILPEALVARTDGAGGAPWAVFAITTVLPLALFITTTALARRAARARRRGAVFGWTTLRAAATVFGLGLAVVFSGIASGADLGPPEAPADTYIGLGSQMPEGFDGQVLRTDSAWALACVAGVVLLWGAFSAWRIHRKNSSRTPASRGRAGHPADNEVES